MYTERRIYQKVELCLWCIYKANRQAGGTNCSRTEAVDISRRIFRRHPAFPRARARVDLHVPEVASPPGATPTVAAVPSTASLSLHHQLHLHAGS